MSQVTYSNPPLVQPVVAPAPGLSTGKLLLIILGSNLFLGMLIVGALFLLHPASGLVPPPPDNILAAATAWRNAESSGYAAVAAQIRAGKITRLDQVEPRLKEAFLPTAKALTDALTQTLKGVTDDSGAFTDPQIAAAALDRAARGAK